MFLELGVTILLVIVGLVYYVFAPPLALRNVPSVPLAKLIRLFMQGTSPLDRYYSLKKDRNGQKIMKIYMQGGWSLTISDPALIKSILTQPDLFEKAMFDQFDSGRFRDIFFGVNVVFSNGNVWRRHRNIVGPAFHRSWTADIFGEAGLTLVDVVSESVNKPIDVHIWTQNLTLDVLGKAAFNYDFGSLKNENTETIQIYKQLMEILADPLLNLFPFLENLPLTLPRFAKAKRLVEKFDEFIMATIKARTEELESEMDSDVGKSPADLLGRMIIASNHEKKASGNYLTLRELRDNTVLFFIAGHDTTANALSCALYYLARNPEVQEKAYQEVMKILENPEDVRYPTIAEQGKMDYLTCIIRETLRLCPSVPALRRVVARDTEIAGLKIAAKTNIFLEILSYHHSSDYWENPEIFNPDRFLCLSGKNTQDDGNASSKQDGTSGAVKNQQQITASSMLAFGYGNRVCLGSNFSLIEQRVVLSMLLQKFKLSLPENSRHKERIIFKNQGLLAPDRLEIVFKNRN